MAIGTVIKRGQTIFVYDEKGKQKFIISEGELDGYTSETVNVRRRNSVFVYNDKGQCVHILPAGNKK